MSTHFVGRERERALLDAGMDTARSGSPRTVLIEGPGGVGKSALAAEWAERLGDVQLWTVSADEAESDLPFGLLGMLMGPTTPVRRDPFAAGAAFLQDLGRQSAETPVALVIDDAHLADTASLAAVTFALRRLRHDPVVAVLTSRTDEVARLPSGLLHLVEKRGDLLTLFRAHRNRGAGAGRRDGLRAAVSTGGSSAVAAHRWQSAALACADVGASC
jgi:predicted ATPase